MIVISVGGIVAISSGWRIGKVTLLLLSAALYASAEPRWNFLRALCPHIDDL
jgi:hypothetical protein